MQSIRTFIPLCTFYFYDVREVDPLLTALVAFLALGSGWLSPWIHRNLPSVGLPAVGVLLAICRLAEQLTTRPPLDLLWAGLATSLFVIALPIHLLRVRSERSDRTSSTLLGIAFLAGLAIDLILHLRLWSLDLSWQTGLWPIALITPICLLLAALSLLVRPSRTPFVEFDRRPDLPLSYAFLGLWLVCEVQIFGNPASLAAYSGISWRQASYVVALSLILRFGAIVSFRYRFLKLVRGWLVAVIFAASVVTYLMGGRWSIAAQLVGSMFGGLLLLCIHNYVTTFPQRTKSSFMKALSCASGPLLFVAILFLYYACFEYNLGFRSRHVLIATATGIALGGIAYSRKGVFITTPNRPFLLLIVMSLLLSGLPILHSSSYRSSSKQPASQHDGVRFMTYNIHQGFNTRGRLDPEAIAAEIEENGATLIALQEVSRGWVVNGSTDILEWLAHRLGMFAYFGATAGPLWGNGLLSKYPLESVESHPLPPLDLPLRRGYLDCRLWVGSVPLRILITHLHHRDEESEVRMIQLQHLLRSWNRSGTTVLAGDLNADPTSATIELLQDAGLTSAANLLPPDRRATILRPTGDRQIDYIWVTPDLAVAEVHIPISRASDHLPIVARIRPLRFR